VLHSPIFDIIKESLSQFTRECSKVPKNKNYSRDRAVAALYSVNLTLS